MRGTRKVIVIVGGPETLKGAERKLTRQGVRVDRVVALHYDPIRRERLRAALARFGPFDVLLVTSREAVRVLQYAGVLPLQRGSARRPRVVPGGPATARALSALGVRSRWSPQMGRGSAVADRLLEARPMRIVYPRSDRAGPSLSRRLTRQGHSVLDLVAYRVGSPAASSQRVAARLQRADRVLVTSPSALSFLRRSLGTSGMRSLCPVVVLGPRSARAARGHGIRGVRTVPDVSDAAVAEFLRRDLTHGG